MIQKLHPMLAHACDATSMPAPYLHACICDVEKGRTQAVLCASEAEFFSEVYRCKTQVGPVGYDK
jgi:hypothetical protein